MKRFNVNMLSNDNIEKIHQTSLNILENIGVKVMNESMKRYLKKIGAATDGAGDRVKIPRQVVQQCLDNSVKDISFYTIDGKRMNLKQGGGYNISICVDPNVYDFVDGKRGPLLKDIEKNVRIGDYLPRIDGIYKMDIICEDTPPSIADLLTLQAAVKNTTKNLLSAPINFQHAVTWYEIMSILNGEKEISEFPNFSFTVSTTSPLQFGEEESRIIEFLGKKGVPMITLPCPVAGMSSPYTLSGTLALSNAEILFLIVLAQSINPDMPVLYGNGPCIFNMKYGELSYGSVERGMFNIAISELAKYYNLPSYTGSCNVDVAAFDIQNGIEMLAMFFQTLFAGVNVRSGMGSIDNAIGVSTEQLIIGHDVLEMIDRMEKGIEVCDEYMDYEFLLENEPGSNFVTNDLTLSLLRQNEHFYKGSFKRGRNKSMLENAYENANAIFEKHKPGIDEAAICRVDRYIERELLKRR